MTVFNTDPVLTQQIRSLSTVVRQLQGLVIAGTGSPEGRVRTPVGRLYQQEDGAPGAQLWQKQTGNNTDTGWVVIA